MAYIGRLSVAYIGRLRLAYSKAVHDTLYVPLAMNKAYGGWTTGLNLRNLGSDQANVTITYYDQQGRPVGQRDSAKLSANGYWGVYQGAGQLPEGFAGSAVISSDQPLGAVTNEINYASTGALSYNAFSGGANAIYLPAVMNDAQGLTTGVNVMNLGGTATITIRYFNSDGSEAGSESKAVEENGYWGIYPGATSIQKGFSGVAVITSSQPLAAIVNEISSDGQQAMSYNGIQ